MAQPSSKTRLTGLDTLRGVTLLSMFAYHACWDLVYLFGVDWPWYASAGAYWWQQSICWSFILLSGFCWPMGRHHLLRGLAAFLTGGAISAATLVVMPTEPILFGVLTFLGTAVLLTIPCHGFLRHVPAWAGLVLCGALFFLLRGVNNGYLGFEGLRLLPLPERLYRGLPMAALGFPPADFVSTDYFSLLPWLFLFWTGYFLRKCVPDTAEFHLRLPVVTAMGRHSLLLYLLHQPVIYGILMLLPL